MKIYYIYINHFIRAKWNVVLRLIIKRQRRQICCSCQCHYTIFQSRVCSNNLLHNSEVYLYERMYNKGINWLFWMHEWIFIYECIYVYTSSDYSSNNFALLRLRNYDCIMTVSLYTHFLNRHLVYETNCHSVSILSRLKHYYILTIPFFINKKNLINLIFSTRLKWNSITYTRYKILQIFSWCKARRDDERKYIVGFLYCVMESLEENKQRIGRTFPFSLKAAIERVSQRTEQRVSMTSSLKFP